jgi:hypothetical protein
MTLRGGRGRYRVKPWRRARVRVQDVVMARSPAEPNSERRHRGRMLGALPPLFVTGLALRCFRRAAGQLRGPLDPGHRAKSRRRSVDLVAEQAGLQRGRRAPPDRLRDPTKPSPGWLTGGRTWGPGPKNVGRPTAAAACVIGDA